MTKEEFNRMSTKEKVNYLLQHKSVPFKADLSEANLSEADLSGADLHKAYLSGADLRGANLTRANLTRANLTRAKLSRADLRGADLTKAKLSRADLRGANLCGANLTRANLTRANLTRAYLSGADLTEAYLSEADLSGANLTRTCLDPDNKPNMDDIDQFETVEDNSEMVYAYRTRKSPCIGIRNNIYEDGKTYVAPCFSTAETGCHPGLYICPSVHKVKKFLSQNEYSLSYGIIKVKVNKKDIHKAGEKWRTKSFTVIEILEN